MSLPVSNTKKRIRHPKGNLIFNNHHHAIGPWCDKSQLTFQHSIHETTPEDFIIPVHLRKSAGWLTMTDIKSQGLAFYFPGSNGSYMASTNFEKLNKRVNTPGHDCFNQTWSRISLRQDLIHSFRETTIW
jgi:hypothetical protein